MIGKLNKIWFKPLVVLIITQIVCVLNAQVKTKLDFPKGQSIEMRMESYEFRSWAYNEYLRPTTGNTFLIFDISFTNNISESFRINQYRDFYLLDKPGRRYKPNAFNEIEGKLGGSLASGDKVRGYIVFEIPQTMVYETEGIDDLSIVFQAGQYKLELNIGKYIEELSAPHKKRFQSILTQAIKAYKSEEYFAAQNHFSSIVNYHYKTGLQKRSIDLGDEHRLKLADCYIRRADQAFADGEYVQCISHCQNAGEFDKSLFSRIGKKILEIGLHYITANDISNAVSAYGYAEKYGSEFNQKIAHGYIVIGNHNREEEMLSQAIEFYQKARNVDVGVKESTNHLIGATYVQIAQNHYNNAEYRDALSALRNAYQYDPDNGDIQVLHNQTIDRQVSIGKNTVRSLMIPRLGQFRTENKSGWRHLLLAITLWGGSGASYMIAESKYDEYLLSKDADETLVLYDEVIEWKNMTTIFMVAGGFIHYYSAMNARKLANDFNKERFGNTSLTGLSTSINPTPDFAGLKLSISYNF